MPAICGQCQNPIPDEDVNTDIAARKPCPICGSTSRSIQAHLNVVTPSVTLVAHAEVITYPTTLLRVARRLIDDGEVGIGTIVCHIACEVAVERSFSDAFPAKGLRHLEDPVMAFVSGHNLANDRIRKLYTALTGDHVELQPFWSKFKASAERRNRIVHAQQLATKEEAEDSHAACSGLVAYLGK